MKFKPEINGLAAAVRNAITPLIVTPLILTPVTALSDEDSVETSKLETVEVIGRKEQTTFANETFSATKFKADILDIGQSISVVTKELIQDQGLVRLNDVTPYVAGANEFSVYNDITIRGFRNFDARRVNGLRVYNDFWSQDVIAHVERVEVIKGPAAVAFGDANPGGVINVVTKKPLDESRHSISARAGSFNEKYIALDTTGPLSDKLLYRVNVAQEDSDSFRDEVFNENTIIAPSLTWLPTDSTRINFDYIYIDSMGILDRGQPNFQGSQNLNEVPIETSLTQPGDELSTTSNSLTLTLDQQITSNWSFAFAFNQVYYDQKLIEHRSAGFVDGSDTQIRLQYNDRDGEADVSSFSSYFTGIFNTGVIEHKLVFGVDTVDTENVQTQVRDRDVGVIDLTQLDNINRQRDVSSYTLEPSNPFGGQLESTGLYVQDQMTLGQWQIMLGLRHDDYDITTVGSDDQSSDSQISPRVSALYRLGEESSVYGSWISGFQPPDPSNNAPINGGPFDPEESELLELGYKKKLFNGNALFVSSIYQITKTNAIVSANDETNPELNVQRGEEQARGFELEFLGNLNEHLLLIANYAYNDAKISKDPDPEIQGTPKEGAPKHAATIWSRYDFNSQFGIGAGVEYIGERYTFEESLKLPSYTLYNASVFYEPTDQLELALQAKNLSDETHWTGGYNYRRLFPGNPRTVSLTANYTF